MKVAQLIASKRTSSVSLDPDTPVRLVLECFRNEDVGAAVVRDEGGGLDGVVTERDIIRGAEIYGDRFLDVPVSTIATTAIASCAPDDHLTDVANVMAARHLHHVAVRRGGRICDVISILDVLDERLRDRRRATRALYSTVLHH